MTAYKVRLKDGVEVGPLDVQMMRSWYEQGMISRDSPVRPTGRKQWVRLIDAVDISDWGAAGGSAVARARPGGEREADGDVVVTAGPAQRWRLFLGSVLFFAAAGAAAWFFFLPERWRPDLRPLAWREVSLALAVLGLLLLLATEAMRKLVRGLVFLGTFALIPLAAFAIVPEIRPRALLALFAAWVMGSGLFFFLAAGHRGAKSVLLSLFWVLAGAAGVLYLGYVPPQPAGAPPPTPTPAVVPSTVAAAPSLAPTAGASMPAAAAPAAAATPAPSTPMSAAAPATGDRTTALLNDVPLLSPLAAESLLGRGPFAPEQGLRVTYATATRGLAALTREEAAELSVLTRATYEAVSAEDRGRLTAYLDRARTAAATTPDEDRAMSALMRDAVLRLPEAQRARLQALFEKAILIAR